MDISDFVGKTFTRISGMNKDSDCVRFENETESFQMYHYQDCCEKVRLEDVCGDPADLIGTPILAAIEVSSDTEPAPPYADSYTWTFYRMSTIKGTVVLRWLGESNGYYSERVDIVAL